MRSGSGTRIKIFEAMAMGKAVVSTTLGAYLIADHPRGRWWKNSSPGKLPLHSLNEFFRTPCPVFAIRRRLERQRKIGFQLISLGVRAEIIENFLLPTGIADLRHHSNAKWIDEL